MSIDTLIALCDYMPPADHNLIRQAHAFASMHHANQTRHSGDPYTVHLEQVAIILAKLHQHPTIIVASLLHDILEDTTCTDAAIQEGFGDTVLALVKGVTKLARINFPSSSEQQAENFRRLFMAMANDIRVIIIKLADRLHNMRTIHHLRPDKQRRIAKETLEIYAPLAHRLGMGSIKWELEDGAFSVLHRDDFVHIKSLISEKRHEREAIVDTMCQTVRDLMHEAGIEADVSGRPKHFYSIYKKIKVNKIEFSQLFDLYGIRIITDTVSHCYHILGMIHTNYKPVEGRIKDYIALPKSNMYQSLHTTVIGSKGHRIEIQIRTQEMHTVAEHGIAAHWMYKQKKKVSKNAMDLVWLNHILEESPDQFIENLKSNLYNDDVFIFTPKGDVIALPKGATILDAAFKIHTDVGLRFKAGIVNGRIVPIQYVLVNGDQIDIHQRRNPQPNLGWLDIVTTRFAKAKIKSFFKRQDAELRLHLGETTFKKILLKYGFIQTKKQDIAPFLERIQAKTNYRSPADIFIAISNKELSDDLVVKACKDDPLDVTDFLHKSSAKRMDRPLILVDGETDIETHIAQCCQPLPGDPILGYITRGFGVAIHHRHCRTVLKHKDMSRMTAASWTYHHQDVYATDIELTVIDRPHLLKDILQELSASRINISKAATTLYKNGRAKIFLTCDIGQLDEYIHIKQRLLRFEDIVDIRRNSSVGES
jgi:guanosine-3',5'-bis(diphosphate) 3'-pyrophosphohydrolase